MPDSAKSAQVTNLAVSKSLKPFYSGGAVDISSDATTLLTACGSVVVVTDTVSGVQKYSVSAEEASRVTCFRLSPNGESVVVAYASLLLRQFKLAESSAEVERAWRSQHRAPVLVMSFGGELLATGGADFAVRVWHVRQQFCTHSLKCGSSVVSALQLADDGRAFAGDAEGALHAWNLRAPPADRLVGVVRGHTAAITSIVLLEGRVATASRDSTIVLWRRSSLAKLSTIATFESLECLAPLLIVPDVADLEKKADRRQLCLSVGESGRLRIWNLDAGRAVWQRDVSTSGTSPSVERVIVCPDASRYCLVTSEQTVLLLDAVTLATDKQFVGYNEEILDAAFLAPADVASSGERLLAVATNSADLRLYDCADWSCSLLAGHKDAILALDAAPWNARLLASGAKDGELKLWRTEAGGGAACLTTATGHTGGISAVRFARTAARFLVTGAYDFTLKLWPLDENDWKARSAKKASRPPSAVTLRAAATVLAHQKDITAVDISPNDKLVASASLDKLVKLWSVNLDGAAAGAQLSASAIIGGHPRGVWDVCFSPTDQVLATACGDGGVRIFGLADRQCVRTLEGHASAALKVRFVGGGRQLLSADSGGVLRLWNIREGECTRSFDAHSDKVWVLLPTVDGGRVVTAGADSTLLVWQDVSESEKAEAEKRRRAETEHEQQLANLLQQRRFADALAAALRLDRPLNALRAVNELITDDLSAAVGGGNGVRDAVQSLDEMQLGRLLGYVAAWNTNGRNAQAAQRVLFELFSAFSPESILKLPDARLHVTALIPYTQRHFERVSRLRQDACFLDYTWSRMRLPDLP